MAKVRYCKQHTVCLTELLPTGRFNNSTPRPGISPSFFPGTLRASTPVFNGQNGTERLCKKFFSIWNFFFQFSKNPLIISIPPAHFFKIILFYSPSPFLQIQYFSYTHLIFDSTEFEEMGWGNRKGLF